MEKINRVADSYVVIHVNDLSDEEFDIDVILYPVRGNFEDNEYISCSIQGGIDGIGYTVVAGSGEGKYFESDEEDEKIHSVVRDYLKENYA